MTKPLTKTVIHDNLKTSCKTFTANKRKIKERPFSKYKEYKQFVVKKRAGLWSRKRAIKKLLNKYYEGRSFKRKISTLKPFHNLYYKKSFVYQKDIIH